MEKLVWILLVFLPYQLFKVASPDMMGWWNIDCGSDVSRIGSNLIVWDIDTAGFTKAGENKRVKERQPLEEMNSLRFFPDQSTQQFCYNLPVYQQNLRYLIRAGFYYGNYDGLSYPPTFDLHIDDKKWSTVNTSLIEGPIYHEAIYVTHGSRYIIVCLVQTRDGEIPFISSLEAVPLWVNLYPQMETNNTFHLVTRTTFGGDEIRLTGLFPDEKYNRIWTSAVTPPNCIEVSTLPDSTSESENDPPYSVLSNSIQSLNASDPIILPVDLLQVTPPQQAYFVFYFTELTSRQNSDHTRIIQIYINGQIYNDGQKKDKVTLEHNKRKVVTIYPVNVVGPTINVTLAPTCESTLPPMISAKEIFTRDLDPVHETRSSSSTHEHLYPRYFILIFLLQQHT